MSEFIVRMSNCGESCWHRCLIESSLKYWERLFGSAQVKKSCPVVEHPHGKIWMFIQKVPALRNRIVDPS